MKRIFTLFFVLITTFSFSQKEVYAGVPKINAAAEVGNYPNTPFLYKIPITGERPLNCIVEGLPNGLSFDNEKNILKGILPAGDYKLTIKAKNEYGTDEKIITIKIGDKLCLTPPLGWNSWNVYAADVTEDIIVKIADAMVQNGMVDLGYQYINIDDFWHARERAPDGKPMVDSMKFPHGMKWLSDYVHSKGLKLGIYSCAGNMTCGKCFGGYTYEAIDAKTYAEWGIDLLKYDYCYAPWSRKAAISRYKAMGDALKNSGRSIVFSVCEWGLRKPWKWAEGIGGHYWRTTPDIFDTWNKGNPFMQSVQSILRKEIKLTKYAGPGHWNDPDMLLVGNYGKGKATSAKGMFHGLTDIQYGTHFALWCFLNAPLLSSADLGNMNDATKTILCDDYLITINQDRLGKQAKCSYKKGGIYVLEKELSSGKKVWLMVNMNAQAKTVKLSSLFPQDKQPQNKRWQKQNNEKQQAIITLPPYEYEIFEE